MPDKNRHIISSRIILCMYIGMYAGANGLGGAALVAIGANIRGHSVYKEMMTLLVGGVIVGSVNGIIRSFFPIAGNSKGQANLGLCLLELGLCYNAFCYSPVLGEIVMNLGTELKQTLENEIVGANVVLTGYVAANVGNRIYKYTSGFFSQRRNEDSGTEFSAATKQNPLPREGF